MVGIIELILSYSPFAEIGYKFQVIAREFLLCCTERATDQHLPNANTLYIVVVVNFATGSTHRQLKWLYLTWIICITMCISYLSDIWNQWAILYRFNRTSFNPFLCKKCNSLLLWYTVLGMWLKRSWEMVNKPAITGECVCIIASLDNIFLMAVAKVLCSLEPFVHITAMHNVSVYHIYWTTETLC